MTIREAIATILVGYGSAKSQVYAGHALARVARHHEPRSLDRHAYMERFQQSRRQPDGSWAL